MNDHCSLLTTEDKSDYEKYIENNIKTSFEYTLHWKNILEKNFGFKGMHIISKDTDGNINGTLPLFLAKGIFGTRLISTPYAIYTGILAENETVKKKLLAFACELSSKEKVEFMEIREEKESDYNNNFQMKKKVFNFSLNLTLNPEEIWKKLPKGSVRWGIKKAQSSNLTWRCSNSESDLSQFYKLFLQTRKVRGVPAYPYSYFKDIVENFKEKVCVYTAYLSSKPVASIFLIKHKKEVRYAFAGAIHKKEIMQLQPYHLLLWEAIKNACNEGFTKFNFGGATLDTNDGGLYEFKKKWVDEIVEITSYFYLNKKKNLSGEENKLVFKLAMAVWKKLPLSWINFLSPFVIKQFV
ncbi:peptidoglycan bridge formation glycyltransferase FemA/FemB family protein [Candidatus Woesearchaeota archaeon]|nr:peptidoglycan bridge formation glycyltransferase FemA/FemB family protein [Candidatus Woesearchaeota archaeon]